MGLFGGKKKARRQILLDAEFFEKLYLVLDQMPGDGIEDERIAYSGREDKQFLDVVGESFCQEDLRKYYKKDKWRYGLLVPEQENKHDPNAVAIYLVCTDDEADDGEFGAYRVGYLKKELAKKVSGKLATLLVQSATVIPVLAMVKEQEGTQNLAVWAYAMTDLEKF